MSKGNLFVISGPSGTGKGTICNVLKEDNDIYLSVSVTTRNRRNEEIVGVTYIYDTVEGFQKRIDNGLMLEWAKYGDNFYGTPRDVIEEKLNQGINVILEIEVQGAINVKKQMPEAVLIFILPPSMKELRDRLVTRGREDEEEINKRISIAKGEMEKARLYNYVVVNDDLQKCIKDVRNIISDRKNDMDFVEGLLKEIN